MRSEQAANEELRAGKYEDAYHVRCRVAARRAELKEASDRKKLFLYKIVAAIGAVCIAAKLFYVAAGG